MIKRIVITLAILAAPFLLALLVTYEVINVEFNSFMEDQVSIKNQEGPVIPYPADSIPFSGVPYVKQGRPPENPYPGDPESIARGEKLFAIHCAVCHGDKGQGNGVVGQYFNPPPPVLNKQLLSGLDDATLFRVLTEGFGRMPRMVENLSVEQRWDVVNYLRSLAQ